MALVVVSLVGAACSGGGKKKEASSSTTAPASSTSTAPPVAANADPFTGLPADPAVPARAALVVKIDNAPHARPQAGINDADIVVEEGVEGGVTRYFTLFHSKDAPAVGPVRSARSTDLLVAHQLGKRQRVVVNGRTAYCAKLGSQMLFVPLPAHQILHVVAPCGIAQRFATVALSHLAA